MPDKNRMLSNDIKTEKNNCFCYSGWLIGVSFYLLALLTLPLWYFIFMSMDSLPIWMNNYSLIIECALFGLIGGCTYCFRSIYISRCVKKIWDASWVSWYFIRPIVSTIMGGITYFIFSAGLIAIGSKGSTNPEYLFYVICFFSGLNVDGFLKKFEGQISTKAGVSESKMSKRIKKNN